MAITDSLVAAYTFEDDGGSHANLGIDAFAGINMTVVQGGGTASVTQAAGKVSKAALFDPGNTNNEMMYVDSAALKMNGTSWEITCWVYPTDLGVLGNRGIFQKLDAIFEYWVYYDLAATYWTAYVSPDGAATVNVHGPAGGVSINTWYFLDLSFDLPNTQLTLRINNAIPAAGQASCTGTNGSTARFYVGNSFYVQPLKGMIDALNIWKRLLTSGERSQLYAAGADAEYPFVASSRRRTSSFYY